jgi:hypothetical protein
VNGAFHHDELYEREVNGAFHHDELLSSEENQGFKIAKRIESILE